jgi:hypothetical protein
MPCTSGDWAAALQEGQELGKNGPGDAVKHLHRQGRQPTARFVALAFLAVLLLQ